MSWKRAGAAAAVLLAAIVGIVSWRATHAHAVVSSVVVITLDTTRADRLSPYGYMNISLPHIERLARDGVVFDQATSVAPLTLPAHTSLFTGLTPPNHGVRDNADTALAPARTTLAEILSGHGFRTGAFVGSVVLEPDRGLAQGFDEYGGVPQSGDPAAGTRQRPANAVVDEAIRWLDTVGPSRFFLWTHLYDPHRPYSPPEPYRSLYGHNPYSGEIAFADAEIGRLLEALRARGLLEHTAVIVTADHGESLGAHGERDHGIFLYEEVLRVPLIVHAPGLRPGRIPEVVRLTDVLPTVLDLVNIPTPRVDGVSLVDLMRGRRSDLNLEAYSESIYPTRLGWSALRAVRDSRFKFIAAPRPELYDLHLDPFEELNLYADRRPLADAMAIRLDTLARGPGSAAPGRPPANAGPELRARLATLGYLASVAATESPGRSLPDPKDCVIASAAASPPASLPTACGIWRPSDDMTQPVAPAPPRR